MNLYANDTAANHDPGIVSSQLEKDLQRVATWIESNGLKMKTQLIVINKNRRRQREAVQVRFGNDELHEQDSVKYLGVEIDKHLCWASHINRVRQKCFASLAAIRRAGAYLPCHTREFSTRPLFSHTWTTVQWYGTIVEQHWTPKITHPKLCNAIDSSPTPSH